MKAIAFIALTLTLSVGCKDPRMENAKATRVSQKMTPERVYTISCEMGGVWRVFETKRHPSIGYGGRSGVWSFLTIDGESVWASNCSARISAE